MKILGKQLPKYEYHVYEEFLHDMPDIKKLNDCGKLGWQLISVTIRREVYNSREIRVYTFMREILL